MIPGPLFGDWNIPGQIWGTNLLIRELFMCTIPLLQKKDIHTYSSFGLQDGTGKTVSSMLVCRIFRDADNPRDTYNHDVGLLEVDIHLKSNSLGSSNMTKKIEY